MRDIIAADTNTIDARTNCLLYKGKEQPALRCHANEFSAQGKVKAAQWWQEDFELYTYTLYDIMVILHHIVAARDVSCIRIQRASRKGAVQWVASGTRILHIQDA